MQRGAEQRPVVEHQANRQLDQLAGRGPHEVRQIPLHKARVVDHPAIGHDAKRLRGDPPARRAPAPRRVSRQPFENRSPALEHRPLVRFGHTEDVLVQVAVVGDLVAVREDRLQRVRVTLRNVRRKEERRRHLQLAMKG